MGISRTTQPVDVNLPKEETEPRYVIKLDNGKVLNYLQEQQLRRMEDILGKAKGRKEKEKIKNQAKEKNQGAAKQ